MFTAYDPWASPSEVKHEYGIDTVSELPKGKKFDAVVLAVAHKEFVTVDWKEYLNENGIIYDVKGCLDKKEVNSRL